MKLFFIQASPFTIITLIMAWYSFEAMVKSSPHSVAPGVETGAAGGGLSGLGDPGRDLRAVCQVRDSIDVVVTCGAFHLNTHHSERKSR